MRREDDDVGKNLPVLPGERSWEDRIQELYKFLTAGIVPTGVTLGRWRNLSPSAAGSLIWFLQEITEVLPDHFDQCASCKDVFDSHCEGGYDEKQGRSYCGSCWDRHCA